MINSWHLMTEDMTYMTDMTEADPMRSLKVQTVYLAMVLSTMQF